MRASVLLGVTPEGVHALAHGEAIAITLKAEEGLKHVSARRIKEYILQKFAAQPEERTACEAPVRENCRLRDQLKEEFLKQKARARCRGAL